MPAALAGVGAAEAVAAVRGSGSFLDAAGKLVVDRGPRSAVEIVIPVLRSADKAAIRAGALATVLAYGALLGGSHRSGPRDLAATTALAAAGVVVSGRFGSVTGHRRSHTQDLLAVTAGSAVGVAALRMPIRARMCTALLGAAALTWSQRQAARSTPPATCGSGDACGQDLLPPPRHPLPPPVDGAEAWPGATPLMTPVEHFYVTDVTMRPPVVDSGMWRLRIEGAVDRPATMSYTDLLGEELVEFDAAMVCVHNRLGWHRLGNQRWTGVPLHRLIERAQPRPTAAVLVTRSVDGWECSLPLDLLTDRDAYLVLGMAGRPLTPAHGYPARVFVPGLYGQYAGAKWVTHIRLQNTPNEDYWSRRGWTRGPLQVRPMARIDNPVAGQVLPAVSGTVTVCGVAWSPATAVAAVEVSLDAGPWRPAELAANLSATSWRRWRAHLEVPAGRHVVRARCLGVDGQIQEEVVRRPFPSGVSGYHQVGFTVRPIDPVSPVAPRPLGTG